ncbi:MAG TPA: ORF6N domain-containing protein [bacterium]|nr:ORF6N domain-containing protein [bacterium]HQN73475.1 ORF6N domain-containing protein [bacterium]HQO91252.1 ORF6N domain-containing protein [bacterium]
MNGNELIKVDDIRSRIFTIRGVQVMLDIDLAELYCVETKVLNQAVKRNKNRFPERFMFMMSDEEKKELVTNCDRLRRLKHSSSNPYAFTEQGVAMLSAVLKSDTAVDISIKIMDAFVSMRHFIAENLKVSQRFDIIEKKQIGYQLESDKKFDIIFKAMENNQLSPKQGVLFDGQVFDAHKLVSDIIRSAEKSIILIDNYVDDTVLTLFSKRKQGVMLKILTKNLSKQLLLDIQKFNEQCPPAEIKEFNHSHDRFLIIDDCDLYHFGASLKDLGKKWFGFSKMDVEVTKMVAKLF